MATRYRGRPVEQYVERHGLRDEEGWTHEGTQVQ
jgi:hypothetical protein